MSVDARLSSETVAAQGHQPGERAVVRRELWAAGRRVAETEGLSLRALARRFELDRKTIRRCLKASEWRPYQRASREDTLLAEHAAFLTAPAPQVRYSAQILYQELTRGHGFRGSYATVPRFVRPLRAAEQTGAGTVSRFETAPGVQSQVDWGFEPRLCRPYRAQTKGKVESGLRYVKGDFLPGRTFVDQVDFEEQLAEWNAAVADTRIHGTTHERPLERFERERAQRLPTSTQAPFELGARVARRVPGDYLVALDTNRYSVPCTLIGQTVEVERTAEAVRVYHRGSLIATHARLTAKHQLAILPEHGPGALPCNVRRLRSSPPPARPSLTALPEVEIRDLTVYDALLEGLAP